MPWHVLAGTLSAIGRLHLIQGPQQSPVPAPVQQGQAPPTLIQAGKAAAITHQDAVLLLQLLTPAFQSVTALDQ